MKQQQKSLDMATKLEEYVRTYDAMVPDDFCQGILEAFGKSDLQYIDREFRPTFTQLNLTQRLQLQVQEEKHNGKYITLLLNLFPLEAI